jgi:ABC-type transport system substrate-binding protein
MLKALSVAVIVIVALVFQPAVGQAGAAKTTLVIALNQDPDILDPSFSHMCS